MPECSDVSSEACVMQCAECDRILPAAENDVDDSFTTRRGEGAGLMSLILQEPPNHYPEKVRLGRYGSMFVEE